MDFCCPPYLIFFCLFIFFLDYQAKLKNTSEIQNSKENHKTEGLKIK